MTDRCSRRAVLLGGAAALASGTHAAPPAQIVRPRRVTGALVAPQSPFLIGCDRGGIASLRFRDDLHATDYVAAGAILGEVRARVRSRRDEAWAAISTGTGTVRHVDAATVEMQTMGEGLALTSSLKLARDELHWEVSLSVTGGTPVEVGDLILPLPMATQFEAGRPATEAVLKHSFVSGHGSHIFWMRSNSVGPFLMLVPERDTQLQYWDVQPALDAPGRTYCAYVHAAAAAHDTASRGTRWRLPTSSLLIAPGKTRRCRFRFIWVHDYAAARAAIVAAGLIDVEVVPGMTVPADLYADISLGSADRIERVTAEHVAETDLEHLPDHAGRQRWRVRFSRSGENRLTLHQSYGRRTELEFFSTEPVETMMTKRAAFIARRQHVAPAKWYDGLFGEWNMASKTLLGPDNYDRIGGWRIYEVTCDDPGLSKPAYLASKNAEHPAASEVVALDRYIERFVWGGLQMTTAERYPYAIYGIPDWRRNRTSSDTGERGRLHIWRPYDYPHIFALYHAMYRVARDHPGIETKRSAVEYLTRAAGTALAMFTVPAVVTGWSAYETGFYNECVIPDLIDDLRSNGLQHEADTLGMHWAKKVRRFVAGAVDLFGSEYAFDSTGFESTQALARSAIDDPRAMGVTAAAARSFADRQIAANLFCRGWLEPAFYYLGSDYRGSAGDGYTLTYMAQMGGWAVLDHALRDARDPYPLLRLGYASQLSAWALLNAGPADSGHGYWYPGEENDGGAGGGFEPAPEGMTWLDQPHHRGSWYYSCEIDLGFCGALRAARTILVNDPMFGRVALGGTIVEAAGELLVQPRDGVRRRFSLRIADATLDVELLDTRFAPDQPIIVTPHSRTLVFQPEPFATGRSHVTLRHRGASGSWERHEVPVTEHGCRLTF